MSPSHGSLTEPFWWRTVIMLWVVPTSWVFGETTCSMDDGTCFSALLLHQTSSLNNHQQCLYLEDARNWVCEPGADVSNVRLRFCSQFAFSDVRNATENCSSAVERLLELDRTVRNLVCQFSSLLERYDCDAKYSSCWRCDRCKLAYREWLCSMLVPYYDESSGNRVKACLKYCHLVERQCPYFHPTVRDQYAGEPVFNCVDPGIPDLPDHNSESVYGLPGQCYCHLGHEFGEVPCPDHYVLHNRTVNTSLGMRPGICWLLVLLAGLIAWRPP